ncbi:histone H3-K56 acetyltransferase, RTT109 [Tanacetum coccineum]
MHMNLNHSKTKQQEKHTREKSSINKFSSSLVDQKHSVFRDISGKYVRSGCTTALNVVPRETDSESVLREACPTRASFHDLLLVHVFLQFLSAKKMHKCQSGKNTRLSEDVLSNVPHDTKDKDGLLMNSFFETRDDFLSKCENSQCQFNTLGHAKNIDCSYPDCQTIMRLLRHASRCSVRYAGGCAHSLLAKKDAINKQTEEKVDVAKDADDMAAFMCELSSELADEEVIRETFVFGWRTSFGCLQKVRRWPDFTEGWSTALVDFPAFISNLT